MTYHEAWPGVKGHLATGITRIMQQLMQEGLTESEQGAVKLLVDWAKHSRSAFSRLRKGPVRGNMKTCHWCMVGSLLIKSASVLASGEEGNDSQLDIFAWLLSVVSKMPFERVALTHRAEPSSRAPRSMAATPSTSPPRARLRACAGAVTDQRKF